MKTITNRFFAISLFACTLNIGLQNSAFSVTLYGAGSLKESLTEVTQDFSTKYGIPVTTQFAPSGVLRARIENGEKVDVFASADTINPLQLYNEGLSNPVQNFIDNRMVAVVRPGLEITSNNLLDFLLNPNIKLATSTPKLNPSGDYAQQIFEKADKIQPGSFQALNSKALQLVGGNPNAPIVPTGKNNLVYFLQDTQQADIFLYYYSGGLSARNIAPNLQIVELPDNLAVRANYGLTVLKNADPNADKLAQYILSPEGQQVLLKYGFTSPQKSISVPESQSIGGILLAVGIAFAVNKKLALKQKVKV